MVDVASIIIIATAFILGLGHSLDPDHVVAVSTLVCKNTSLRKSVVSATAWGAGHSIVLLLAGLVILILRIAIPESVVSLFEFAAGAMLVILGIWVLKPLTKKMFDKNELETDSDATHIHLHSHIGNTKLEHEHYHSHVGNVKHEHAHGHVHKSLFTGVLQGLAGSAAIMLVTLTTVTSTELGLVFIVVFGSGVILGMVSISCLLSSLFTYTASHLEKIHLKIVTITGLLSVSIGVFIIIEVILRFLSKF